MHGLLRLCYDLRGNYFAKEFRCTGCNDCGQNQGLTRDGKTRIDGVVRDVAVLIAIGVQQDGKRTVLGVSAALNEVEVHWRQFLMSLAKLSVLVIILKDIWRPVRTFARELWN